MAEMPPSALIASTTASSSSDRQSHRTLAVGVRRNKARWPMAKCGSTPTPISPGFLELDRVAVGQPQLVQRGPLLARGLDVLPLVLADGAGGGRLIALGVLRPAGRADEVRHGSPPARQPPHPRRDQFHQIAGGVTKVKGLAPLGHSTSFSMLTPWPCRSFRQASNASALMPRAKWPGPAAP